MSKKKSSPNKNSSNKRTSEKKQVQMKKKSSKKLWIILASLLAVIAITVTVVLVCCLSGPGSYIDLELAEANLKKAGYEVTNYAPELNGYYGVVKTVSATYTENKSDSLADYVNAEKEVIYLVKFDSEENAQEAYTLFCQKWTDKYDEYGIAGDTVYFGTSDALDIAIENTK